MELRPITLRAANAYVAENHRHSSPTRGHRFSLAAYEEDRLIGVVIVGRPVARGLEDGLTAEVLRVCTDGTRNACSFLYGAAARVCRAMGFRRVVTYTLDRESGSSLKAVGWKPAGHVTARDWDTPSRRRDPAHHERTERIRWELST